MARLGFQGFLWTFLFLGKNECTSIFNRKKIVCWCTSFKVWKLSTLQNWLCTALEQGLWPGFKHPKDSVDKALQLTRPSGVCTRGLPCHWDWESVLPSTRPPSSWRSPSAESHGPARTFCPCGAQWVRLCGRLCTPRPCTDWVPILRPARLSGTPSPCVVGGKKGIHKDSHFTDFTFHYWGECCLHPVLGLGYIWKWRARAWNWVVYDLQAFKQQRRRKRRCLHVSLLLGET